VVLLGGAPAPDTLVERCRDFSVPVYPTYGMTETSSQVATATPREAFDDVGTVGRPLFWTDVTVRDGDGATVDPGESGELVVDGPTVSPGYYENPDATGAAFGPHGLRTGDVGYLDEHGRLFVLGRVDDQIITGGENVHPREVVDVLREHPQVDDVVVVGVPDDEWGELVGALVVGDADELTVDDLEGYCRERLAGFKLPRVISFAEALPRTASGTVERETVRDRLVEGMTESDVGPDIDIGVDADLVPESTETGDPTTRTGDESDATGGARSDAAGGDTGDVTGPTATGVPDGARETTADEAAETFLIGGSDWRPGDPLPDEDGTDDPDPATADDGEQPAEAPETPDFVREVLSDDQSAEAVDDVSVEPNGDAADEDEDGGASVDEEEPEEREADVGDDETSPSP
jgi:O-succinylbenzoic acid--CoA ligase